MDEDRSYQYKQYHELFSYHSMRAYRHSFIPYCGNADTSLLLIEVLEKIQNSTGCRFPFFGFGRTFLP